MVGRYEHEQNLLIRENNCVGQEGKLEMSGKL
jgi:hypothetical protein